MYKVFDLETEVYSSFKRKASPFDTRNWIVARGWKNQGDTQCSWEYIPKHDRTTILVIEQHITMLVGFNIKFDLLWEMAQGNQSLREFYKRGGKVWCCQYAEYLLRAQHPDAHMASLDETAPRYGGLKKIDAVKALWEAGTLTQDIPEDLLIDYLVGTPEELRNGGDIRNTEVTFLGQIKLAVEQNQVKMIQDRMDGLLATTEMEFNGLKVDVAEASRRLKVLTADLEAQEAELDGYVPTDLPFVFNWSSRVHTSCLIFGGTAKYQLQTTYTDPETGELARKKATEAQYVLVSGETTPLVPIAGGDDSSYVKYLSGKNKGSYKTKNVDVLGELKVKYQDFLYTFPRITEPNEKWATKNTDGLDAPLYSTGGDIIVELALRDIPFIKALRNKQKLDKEIGTYYVKRDAKGNMSGMLTCVQTHDHMIHHKLNHSSTVTSRLSSSNPNGQNLPRGDKSEVKAMFISRFTEEYCKAHDIPYHYDAAGMCRMGEMIEADYSQLEVVVQGVLTGDEQLCQDLRDRVDFHCKRVSAKFMATASYITYEYALEWCKNEEHPDYKAGKKERTKCKIFSFQRAYGAGAPTIAEETGMSLEETQALIKAEDELYPGVVVFNAAVESAVIKSAIPFQALGDDGKWKTYRRGYWIAPTGTRYTWRSYDAPEYARRRGQTDTFNPPEMKNYPVQGTGGEMVQVMGGRLWRRFVETDNYGGLAFLVNTVHDCNWADVHTSVRDEVASDMKRIMESIPEYYNARYGMNITVPFPVEVEFGPNMNKLHHWTVH